MAWLVAGWLITVVLQICFKLSTGFGLGSCPRIAFMPNFSVNLFTGHWYEIERSFYLMEIIASCVSVDIKPGQREELWDVDVSSKSRLSGGFSISRGTVTLSKKDPSLLIYKVNSKFPRSMNRFLPGSGYYQVVKTDYEKYAIIYSCTNFHIFYTDLVWIWARNHEIDAQLRAEIYDVLKQNHIDPDRLTLSKNKNCTKDY